MRVGFDLDGVLYNFGDSVRRFLEETERGHLWKSGPTPEPFWEFYKDWGWTTDQFIEMCNDGVDAGVIFRGAPRPNAVEAVQEIADAGHEIILITDRQFGSTPEASHRATRLWWEESNFPVYQELHFSADKTCVQTDVFIEDKLQNYDDLMNAGTPAVLVNRAWNVVDGGDMRLRISDVSEYPQIVAVYDYLLTNDIVW